MCEHLRISTGRFIKNYTPHNYVLLQICNTFWLFLVEITKRTENDWPLDYTVELLTTWKNYVKARRLIKLDIISFDMHVNMSLYHDRFGSGYDKSKIMSKADILAQAVDTNNYRVDDSINKHRIINGDNTEVEKHIPLLKACGIGSCIDPLEVFLSFEEYFSLERASSERTASIGLTDAEKIGNHGFDAKTSFRGKTNIS